MPVLEVFFDCSSPWTYLGFDSVTRMAERLHIDIRWKPIVVGGVFNKVNRTAYSDRENPPVPAKWAYYEKDLQDWAGLYGLVINMPPKCGHPVNSVKCMRGCILLQPLGKLVPFARAAFEALWADGQDLGDDNVLRALCDKVAVDPEWFLTQIGSPEIKSALWDNTNDLIERGGFGSPTFFVDSTAIYFGNDRVVLVENALRKILSC